MLLEPLINAIETLKERIRVHGDTLRGNETRTRMALIDPLLTTLGWDTSDPSLVLPEYTAGNGRADYALLRPNGKPAALVETKKLGEVLSQHRDQMLTYSNTEGVPYVGLTEGNQWEFYEVFKPRPLEERRILQLSISELPAYECALRLLLLWRHNLGSNRPSLANGPALVDPPSEEAVVNPPTEHRETPAHIVIHGTGWTPISQVTPSPGDSPPKAIRFNQGSDIEIHQWNHVLTHTIEWLCREGKLTSQNIPIATGKIRNLAAASPTHRNGTSFKNIYKTSNGIFIETKHSSKDCIAHTVLLLNKLAVDVAAVEVRFDAK